MRHIKAFPWWTHKILPLVYDESLSYYEFLCKVMAKLNEIIEHDTEQDEQIEANRVAIENEITRATNRENEIEGNLNNEIARATERENQIEGALNKEIKRSITEDELLNVKYSNIKTNIASEYSEGVAYQKGVMLWKDNDLITALVDIPENTPFDENMWAYNPIGLNQHNSVNAIGMINNYLYMNFAPLYDENDTYYPSDIVCKITPANDAWESTVIRMYKCISETTGVWNENDWELYQSFAGDIMAHLNKLFSQYIKVANGYSENTIYNTGNYVWKDTAETLKPWNFGTYELYRCNEDNVTGAWNAEKWVSISNIMGEIQRVINSANTNYEYLLGLIQNLTLNVNQNSSDIVEINRIIETVFNSMGVYDDTKQYSAGMWVWHNDAIYKCVNATTGNWNANDWTEVKFFDDVTGNFTAISNAMNTQFSSINQRFTDVYRQIGQNDDTSFTRYTSLMQSIAPIYKENATYNVGDLVYYSDENVVPILYELYRCINQTKGAWNLSDWAQTTIKEEIKNSGGGSGSNYVQNGLEIQSKNIGRGVVSPSLIDPARYKTIECCFKWDGVDTSTNMGRAVSLENSGEEIFAININQNFANNVEWKAGTWTDDGKSGFEMPANSYHTFSFVFFEENNTEKVSVYYDGAKVATQDGSLGTNSIIRICFKQSYAFVGRNLDGNIKNFRVYSRALTDNEILLNYAIDVNS